jgi:rhodanese-related sulfurtransferase
MKPFCFTVALFFALLSVSPVHADDSQLEKYISGFDYPSRHEMNISSEELIELLGTGKAQLIDVRFKEEYAAWNIASSLSIPLNELPKRLAEIDENKIVVTACPHQDRSSIAMAYLRSKGIPAKYLRDGLLGLTDQLRGDKAAQFMDKINKLKR